MRAVERVVEEELRWLFREQREHDFGIDAHMEIVSGLPPTATGRLFALQIKYGDSFFREGDELGWHIYLEKSTVDYWLGGSLPTLLVLVRPDSRECFWTHISADSPSIRETAQRYRITVPRTQRLNAEAHDALLDLDAGAVVTTSRYFGHLLDAGRVFHHARPLVGRRQELAGIMAARSEGFSVVELAGRGGIGKSRLLLEAARRLEEAGWSCRWVRDHVELTFRATREIPRGRIVLIADDVHLRSDLPALCEIARTRDEPTLLLLGFRPWARPLVRAALRGASIPLEQVTAIQDLGELRRGELLPLVRAELGPELEDNADSIISNLRDSTLVCLAAARFLRERRIPPALLERSAEFRHEVLSRFEDAIVGDFAGRVEPARAKALLRLVSVSGPVRADDPGWLAHAAAFLQIPPYELAELVAVLEAGEILAHRDGRVRVIPDVLAEHLVYVAVVTETGTLSGYPRFVLERFGHAVLPQLTTNLAELDWRLKESGEPAPVLDEVWEAFREAFRQGDNYERLHLLHALRPVALRQPERVYELCRWLGEDPSGESHGYEILADTRVLGATLPLLEEILEYEEWFVRAATLIYRFGRDRPTPDPLNGLKSRIGYHPERPSWIQRRAVDCLEAWTSETQWADRPHTPLELADTLLRKEDIFVLRSRRSYRIAPHPIPPEPSHNARLRLIALVGTLARRPSRRGRLLACDALLEALRPPPRTLGRTVNATELEGWLAHDLAALAELSAAAEEGDPLVRIRVKDGLSRIDADRSLAVLTEAAAAAAARIEETHEMSLYRAWSGVGPALDPTAVVSLGRHRRPRAKTQRLAYVRGVVRQFIAERSAAEVAEALATVEGSYASAGLDARPDDLLESLATENADLAIEVAREIAAHRGEFAGRVGALLSGVSRTKSGAYRTLLAEFAATAGPCLRSLAGALARVAARRPWTRYEASRARQLAGCDDAMVRGSILHAVALGRVDPRLALELLSSASVGTDLWLGELFAEAADVVLERGGDIVDRSAAWAFLKQLARVPRFTEGYGVPQFLSNVASRWPDLLTDFVVDRIRRIEEANRIDDAKAECEARPRALFRAIPAGDWSQVWDSLRASPGYGRALAKIRDEAAQATGEPREELLRVFRELAGVDEATAACLLEWLGSGDRLQLEGALPLIQQLPRGFVFAMPRFVERVLDAAYALGTDVGADVSLGLRYSLHPRVGFRGDEYVGHLEWTRQHAEACAADVQSDHARRFFASLATSACRAFPMHRRVTTASTTVTISPACGGSRIAEVRERIGGLLRACSSSNPGLQKPDHHRSS